MNLEDRLKRCRLEFGDRQWDIIIFAETWRQEAREAWELEEGHHWFGSGGSARSCGVGVLLNKRWVHTLFRPLSNRLAILDVKISSLGVLRCAAVYMPHVERPDEEVDVVYAQLEDQTREASRKCITTIIVGDFNAQVGPHSEFDDDQIVGNNSMP